MYSLFASRNRRSRLPKSARRQGFGRLSAPESLESRQLFSAAPMQVAQDLVQSSDYRAHVVETAYETYLGRSADADGSQYWVGQMANGVTKEQMEADFIGSPEYINDHGGAGQGWVSGMYEDLLGREPDAAGLQYWDAQLAAGADPTSVAHGFAASLEREAIIIQSIYGQVLGRQAAPDEVNFWVNAFANGTSSDQIMAGFVGSDEFFQQHGSDDREWFEAAYADLFGLTPDAGTENSWLDQMGYDGPRPTDQSAVAATVDNHTTPAISSSNSNGGGGAQSDSSSAGSGSSSGQLEDLALLALFASELNGGQSGGSLSGGDASGVSPSYGDGFWSGVGDSNWSYYQNNMLGYQDGLDNYGYGDTSGYGLGVG